MRGAVTPLPQYVFMAWCLVKQRDNLSFFIFTCVAKLTEVIHFWKILYIYQTRDSSVGIELGYGLDERGSRVRFPAGAGNFSLHHRVQNGPGPTQPPIQWVPGALSLWVKRPGREADHSPPSSADVKECVEL
jgi:hypothetical protein